MAKHEVKSMLPGIFYRKPAPDQPSFKEVGDAVAKGDVLGLIEVMKSFHDVTCDVDGVISRFPVNDSDAITPGMILVEIEV